MPTSRSLTMDTTFPISMKAGCITPAERFTPESMAYDQNDQGRSALEVILGLVVGVASAQGRGRYSKQLTISKPAGCLRAAQVKMLLERKPKASPEIINSLQMKLIFLESDERYAYE